MLDIFDVDLVSSIKHLASRAYAARPSVFSLRNRLRSALLSLRSPSDGPSSSSSSSYCLRSGRVPSTHCLESAGRFAACDMAAKVLADEFDEFVVPVVWTASFGDD